MKNRSGFTYIEVMIAITIFLIMSVFVIRLNITANKNINGQILRQNMMMEAQKILEKTKNNPDSDEYKGDSYKNIDGYYINIRSELDNVDSPNLFEITVKVRQNVDEEEGEVVLRSHFFKK